MKKNLVKKEIVDRLLNFKKSEKFIPLHSPTFNGNEEKYLVDCVKSNFVSSVGEYVNRFERALESFTGIDNAILTVNGTSALHISLISLGVNRGDEVLLPAMTFVATANAISYIGAIPHFIDVNENTLGVDSDKLEEYLYKIVRIENDQAINVETGKIIKAIIPMHTFGHSVDMDKLHRVAKKFKLEIIEDSAESLGSKYNGKHTGKLSKLSAISFNGNKIITTGGGGAILTDSDELASKIKHFITTAKKPHKWEYEHDKVGYNYRMPAINASLGLAQLEQLAKFIKQKRELAKEYRKLFKNFEDAYIFKEPDYAKSNYWLNALILKDTNLSIRNYILKKTNLSGFMTRPVWKLISNLTIYKNSPSMNLDSSKSLENRIINIPSSPWLIK